MYIYIIYVCGHLYICRIGTMYFINNRRTKLVLYSYVMQLIFYRWFGLGALLGKMLDLGLLKIIKKGIFYFQP